MFNPSITYNDIKGWMDFENVLSHAIYMCETPAKFLEVGVAFGKSLVYTCHEAIRAGKAEGIEFYAVDHWPSDDGYNAFKRNVMQAGIAGMVKPIRCASTLASAMFEDNSIDFILIDADHRYEAVKSDIARWIGKVRRGGLVAMHD